MQHELALPRATAQATMAWMPTVLLTNDPTATAARLDAGHLACPSCGGRLGPWGHARERTGPRLRPPAPPDPVPSLPGHPRHPPDPPATR